MNARLRLLLGACVFIVVSCSPVEEKPTGDRPNPTIPFKAADYPNIPNTVYGQWGVEDAEFGNGLAYYSYFFVSEDGPLGVAMTCQGQGEEVTAAIQSTVEITASHIVINQSSESHEKGRRIADCAVAVTKSRIPYRIQNDKLFITQLNGNVVTYIRIDLANGAK